MERRGRSFSHSSVQDHLNYQIPDSSLTSQLNQTSLSSRVEHQRTASSSFDNQSVSSHVSSIIEEVSTDEEVPALRTKIQELEAELSSLRQAMEQNEQSILQVQEDKRNEWQTEVARLKKELDKQTISAADNEQTLQSQVLRFEQENTRLRQKMEHLEEASLNLRNSHQPNVRKPSDENSNYKSKKLGMDTEESTELSDLREKVQQCHRQLLLEREKVRKLEQDLDDARKHNWQETPDLVKKQFGCDQEEVKNLRASLEQLSEVKINLSKQVSIQEDELQLLQRKLEDRDKELAQEKSEIAYLRDVQDRLQVDLKNREKDLKQVRLKNAELVSKLQTEVREKEREVEAVHSELRELRLTKNQEISELEKQVLRKESESMQLQSQLQETESKSGTKSKRRSFKSTESLKNTQKQLEQDFIALQVKLTKREQELFQLRREAALKQENIKEERDTVKRKLALCDGDLKSCRDKLQMRDEELVVLQEKLQDREKEIANLYDKLERQQQMAGRYYSDGRSNEPLSKGTESDRNPTVNIDVNHLKRDLQELQEKLRRQEVEFDEEMNVWQKEKAQVLQYQKQLQLNYMQMGQKNRKLEQEVQQLTAELERTDVIHC